MADDKHPIIARGELYVEPITKKGGGGPKKIPHEYNEAKLRILNDLSVISQEIKESSEIFLGEKIVCIRMEPKFEAKSYVPSLLVLSRDNMDIVGGRKYSFINDQGEEQSAKLYFMRTNNKGIEMIQHTLEKGLKDNTDKWCDQIGSIHSLDLLTPDEKIMGLENNWDEGVVEIVLHPMNADRENMIALFYKTIGISKNQTAIKSYEGGLTFISAKCSRKEVEKIKKFNPLRALHPLGRVNIVPMRGNAGFEAPTIAPAKSKSKITIGVFDGGADDTIPLLKGYTKSFDRVAAPSQAMYTEHAAGVCGVVLHGNLADKSKSDILPVPTVSVDSFRVLPLKGTNDFEAALGLYEAIDAIESVVKERQDIKIYNISFGPQGAIFDDSISRFTYVMDRLTYDVEDGEVNPLFCIAVGNDGELIDPLNRIQAPADMVNGLGIGAYTYTSNGEKIRTTYSCIGSGREGAKVKPDFLEFGGSKERPFVLVGAQHNTLSLSAGTSFASPNVAGKIGKLMARCESVVPHLGRTLLIHNASAESNVSQGDQGYGFCIEDVEEVLSCEDKKVTILYSGTLVPGHTVKLPIFAPDINNVKGTVNISWTIATIVDPCANDPDAYTNNCIEDVFIPHDLTFNFTKQGDKTFTLNLAKAENAVKAQDLLNRGYKRSDLPVSKPAKKIWNETELRMSDLKWDTVIKKGKTMQGSSLLNPYLTLHAIGRNGYEARDLKYFTAVTINAKKYTGSLYDSILQTYQSLIPIEIRNTNRIMVPIN
ncbi:MAG: S8 family peptidase [Desulfosporosinus sp.]|nr:S8 family peptidase [Desulfosporosinus sp.]